MSSRQQPANIEVFMFLLNAPKKCESLFFITWSMNTIHLVYQVHGQQDTGGHASQKKSKETM
jgi:hypothetical protein